jgi:PAS domain S-box-containing protein
MRLGGLGVLYVVTAMVGLSLDAVSGFAAAVWPPSGLALAALVLFGYGLWPAVAVGAFVVNWSVGAPGLVASGMALGNTLEALIGAMLLKRVVEFHPTLERLQDVVGLIVLAAGLSSLISATIGVTSGWLGGVISASAYGEAWRTWWLGDALGMLVVAPLLCAWSKASHRVRSRRWMLEAAILLVALGALCFAVFTPIVATPLVARYLVFPPLIWAAVRLGPPGVVSATALVSAATIWWTVQGVGPFTGPTLRESLISLQVFMGVVAMTGLVLAAAVAERWQAEATAHEQRERLHVTLSSIGDAVIAFDVRGRVTFMNPVAELLTGWPAAEAVGRDVTAVFRIVNEFTRQVTEDPIGKVIRAGTVVGLANHSQLIARDGVERPVEDSAAPIYDREGRLLGVVLVFRDITARRQAEMTREQLAAIVESSEDAIIGKTLDGTITAWNRGAERLYGYAAAEVVGRCIALLCPPEMPDEIPRILQRLARGEYIEQYETQRLRRDGSRVDVSLTISPIRDPAGQIVGAATIARDITERRRAQQRFSIAVEAAPNAMILVNQDGRILLANAHTEQLFGYTRQELLGQSIEMLVPKRARQAHSRLRAEFVQQPSTRPMGAGRDLYGRRKDGTEVPIEIGLNPIETLDGLGVLAAVVDITARKRTEQAVQQAYAELEQRVEARTAELRTANKALQQEMAERQRLEQEAQRAEHFVMLGRLAAGISHDIRNPLATISLRMDLLEEELHEPSSQSQAVLEESLAEVRSQLARLEELVQNYLALARVARLDSTPQDLGATLEGWAKEWQALATARGVTLQLAVGTDCGLVAFHESTLRRVLLNLVQNALDAMPSGGTLTVTSHGTPAHVQLVIRDTGSGIPAEQLPKIFEPLYTTKPEGTGLGLYIAQEIVAAHGGQITVESVEGHGTTFTITMPRSEDFA